jgi:flap endonuclease-1
MGIPKLNAYLLNHCSKHSIDKKHLSIFSGKTIVIDTSIYLYKFAETNCIIESLYQMIRTFAYYNIKPIFVFDGKPPDEKKALIHKRNDMKSIAGSKQIAAEVEYETIYELLNKTSEDFKKLDSLKILINNLKKQCVRVSRSDSDRARSLLTICNIEYYNAEGEADELCAHMVLSKKAWACMSDDMDMLVHGCTRVMRGLSMHNHTVTFYNINGILRDLDLNITDFRRIAVFSGTDYNISHSVNIADVFEQFYVYKKLALDNTEFYDWYSQLKQIKIDNDKLINIYNMFCNNNVSMPPKQICIINKVKTISEFLRPYGFVFAYD